MARSLHVLVADDNPINLRVVARVLKGMGHGGVLVTDGAKALRALDGGSFDVLLLDVNMPILDGMATLAAIREREQRGRAKTTVIMVTAHDQPSDRRRVLDAGADGYLAKPVSDASLQDEFVRLRLV